MKKTFAKTAAACGLCLTLLAGGMTVSAANSIGVQGRMGGANFDQQPTMFGGWQQGGQFGGMQQNGAFGQMRNTNVEYAASAGTIVTGTTTNGAASLEADYENATTITMSDENNAVKIKASGTYIVTGSCSDGNITVTTGTTGVVLILKDLNLTSTIGATLSVNKTAEAKIIIAGSVTLTDAEDPANEDSDDFDGAAIKVKAGASACITGSGTLTLNGSAKNGIKVSGDADDDEGYGSLVIDGATINVSAANDGINGNYDVAILSGRLTISAADDAIHADRILTIGADGSGPSITVSKSCEGIEATVVNIAGGTISVTSSDDGINAANGDGTFKSEMEFSINVTGGDITVNAGTDGFDSNGNINLINGSATIRSANNGGDAGLDYDGQLYISDEFDLNNYSGVAGPDNMMGGMPGQMGGMQRPDQQTQDQRQNRNADQDRQDTAPTQNADQPRQFGRQNQIGAPGRNMPQMPMQNQDATQNGGLNNGRNEGDMGINGGRFPCGMPRQMMR